MRTKLPPQKLYLGLAVVLVIVLGILWQTGVLSGQGGRADYQAVFLSNNQVYFGKLSNAASQYPVLKDIYYLQVTQVLQPADPNAPQQQLNLVKLGGELHGPKDEMRINRDQILFVEDLKPDSQVVTAIESFKQGQ